MPRVIRLPFRFYVAVFLSLSVIFYQLSGNFTRRADRERSPETSTYSIILENSTVQVRAPMSNEHEKEIIHRKKVMDDTCAMDETKLIHSDARGHILINTKVNMGMCFVPKTGCTFWKRIMYKLQQIEQHGNVKELFDISKRQIHSMPIRKLLHFEKFQDGYDFWRKAKKIVFVRDPYSRLFSAYVDNKILPDFWASGPGMLKKFRQNVSAESLRCGHDVSFEEFLQYATEAEASSKYMNDFVDDHWQPVSRICQPCQLEYDVVAKQETFSADREFIVEKLGISSILPQSESISRDDTAKDAMNQTIDTYWRAALKEKPCVTQIQLVQRFWRSYQIQGYIPSALALPIELLLDIGDDMKEPFRKIAITLYDQHKLSPEEWKRQRKEEMIKAYKTIPTDLMMKIQKCYRLDFELFSYKKQPEELYSFR